MFIYEQSNVRNRYNGTTPQTAYERAESKARRFDLSARRSMCRQIGLLILSTKATNGIREILSFPHLHIANITLKYTLLANPLRAFFVY